MAIQPMALNIQTPKIDAVGDFSRGQAAGLQIEGMKREQAMQGIQQIAAIALGAKGGKMDGPVDPQRYEQGLDLLEQQGVDVTNLRGKPEYADTAVRASMTALEQIKLAQSERDYQQALREFDAKINGGGAPEAGLNVQWFKDAGGNMVSGQALKSGGFLINGQTYPGVPDGLTPQFPVDYLNTGDQFVGTEKFGGATGDAININNRGKAFETGIGANVADQFGEARVAASDARQSLMATAEARRLIDEGVITGFGADYALNFGKALQTVGINLNSDAVANTEAFVATRAQEVGRIIKLFGAGTGLSDADREFATKAAAGQITMTKEAIVRILDINERAARAAIDSYNKMAAGVNEGQMPDLTIEAPTPTSRTSGTSQGSSGSSGGYEIIGVE